MRGDAGSKPAFLIALPEVLSVRVVRTDGTEERGTVKLETGERSGLLTDFRDAQGEPLVLGNAEGIVFSYTEVIRLDV